MPPPWLAVLPERVELEMVRVSLEPLKALKMAPPKVPAVLAERVELAMLRMPKMKMPPPLLVAELPERS